MNPENPYSPPQSTEQLASEIEPWVSTDSEGLPPPHFRPWGRYTVAMWLVMTLGITAAMYLFQGIFATISNWGWRVSYEARDVLLFLIRVPVVLQFAFFLCEFIRLPGRRIQVLTVAVIVLTMTFFLCLVIEQMIRPSLFETIGTHLNVP